MQGRMRGEKPAMAWLAIYPAYYRSYRSNQVEAATAITKLQV